VRFSVIIPAYNEEKLLPRTLASVRASFAAVGNPEYEIVVCDNNSTDRTARVAEAAGARVVFEPHNQIARARNAGAERSRGEWLIFLDADTMLNADLLALTLRAIDAGGLCGGGSLVKFDRGQLGWLPDRLARFWNRVSQTANLAAGSYVFCLRTAWEAVGGFDRSVYAGEEIYFSIALKRWGKPRRLRFRVLTGAPIATSARKMDWYSPWQIVWQVARLMVPWANKRRAACEMWYERPQGE
jgi:glycosyltransferase involved in cell wall biosynthesis